MADTKTARFTISGDNGEVQDVGYRIFVFTTLDGYGLDVAKPINIPGDGVQVTVKGDEEIIRSAINELRKVKPLSKKVGKIKVSDPEFGTYDFNKFNTDEIQMLILNQLSKGILAIEEINGVVGKLDGKYHNISLTLYAQLGISIMILGIMLYAISFVLR